MICKHPTAHLKKYRFIKGFSLLEAIVALALISLTGMAIFSWLNQSLGNLSNLNRQQMQSQLAENAFSYIKTINPMVTPDGTTQLGSLHLTWHSKLMGQPDRAVGSLGNFTNYQMGLYLLDVTLQQPDTVTLNFSVRQVGYLEIK